MKGYTAHKRETLDAVTQARTRAVAGQSASPALRAAAEGELTNALRGLAVAVEAYPQRQASGGFRDLRAQLVSIEDAVQNPRRYYNAVVRDFNTAVSTLPSNLFAGPMAYKELEIVSNGGRRSRAAVRQLLAEPGGNRQSSTGNPN